MRLYRLNFTRQIHVLESGVYCDGTCVRPKRGRQPMERPRNLWFATWQDNLSSVSVAWCSITEYSAESSFLHFISESDMSSRRISNGPFLIFD